MADDLDIGALERRLAALENGPQDAPARIDALIALSWALGVIDTHRCQVLTKEIRSLSQSSNYARGLAYALRNEAYVTGIAGDSRASLALAEQAERAMLELQDQEGEATVLDTQFHCYERIGDFLSALSIAHRGLKLNRAIGHRRQEAWALHNLGWLHAETEDFEKAEFYYQQSLKLFREIGYITGEGRVLDRIAQLFRLRNNLESAFEYQKKAMEIFETTNVGIGIAMGNAELGRLSRLLGRHAEARNYFLAAVAQFERTPNLPGLAQTLTWLGQFDLEEGRLSGARTSLERALRVLDRLDAFRFEYPVHETLGALCEAEGNLKQALVHAKEHLRLKDQATQLEQRDELNRMKLRMDIERAEKDAEIHRLKYVELQQMQAQLVDTEKKAMLGSLAAGLAHEINNPIGVIKSNADVAQRAIDKIDAEIPETAKKARRALNALRHTIEPTLTATTRIQDLAQSLKRFVRLDEASFQTADVVEGLESALLLFESQLPDRIKITRQFRVMPSIRCRPVDLNQVFMTLLVNASEAIDQEGIIHIETECRSADPQDVRKQVVVTVADTGRGIPEDKRASLFDVGFSQKGTRVRFHSGLATAANTIEQHGGTIEVESEPGQGTTFRISLPVSAEDQRP